MNLWKQHGTKIIGGATTIVAALSVLDPITLTAILGAKGVSYLMAASGILTILRGLQNSRNQGAPKP